MKHVYEENKENKKYDILNEIIKKNDFLCSFCFENEKSMITNVEIKISDLIETNKQLKECIPYNYELLTNKSIKLWKRVLKLEEIQPISENKILNLLYNNTNIHNQQNVLIRFMDELINNNGLFSCLLCASDVRIDLVKDACGTCSTKICKTCFDNWFNEIQPGKIALYGNTVCPFCKNNPKYKLIDNLCLSKVKNVRLTKNNKNNLCKWKNDKIYALCMKCVNFKEAFDKNCAGDIPVINNFICGECKPNMKEKDILTKECPKCKTTIQKIGGCNHITCNCGSHWCWSCGIDNTNDILFNSHTIYDHLSKCKGIFSDGDFNDEYINDDYDMDEDSDYE